MLVWFTYTKNINQSSVCMLSVAGQNRVVNSSVHSYIIYTSCMSVMLLIIGYELTEQLLKVTLSVGGIGRKYLLYTLHTKSHISFLID